MSLLYLASKSPRRQDLLRQIGVRFRLLEGEIDESPLPGESPTQLVQRLASDKARAGRDRIADPDAIVLGADTVVVVDDVILGKPRQAAEAAAMLRRLSGRGHQVLSAVSLWRGSQHRDALSLTQVYFRPLDDDEIARYWHSGEPRDKAGAYGIQGFGAVFVERIEGSYSGVVGLPIEVLVPLLRDFAIPCWQSFAQDLHLADSAQP